MSEQNKEILKEVIEEIEQALKDPKGIVSHQRRLAFSLSLGTVSLIENYLEHKNILKKGSKINHLWFKKKRENIKKLLSEITISSLDNLLSLDKILDLAFKIEKERNELAYGFPAKEERLREQIILFLKLKKEIEKNANT